VREGRSGGTEGSLRAQSARATSRFEAASRARRQQPQGQLYVDGDQLQRATLPFDVSVIGLPRFKAPAKAPQATP